MAQEMPKLYVAAAQIGVTSSLEDNLARILTVTEECARAGVELVVFPETSLTGYAPYIGHGRGASEWPAIAEALAEVASTCARLGIWVVVGTEAWTGEVWENRLEAISDAGETVASYSKVRLTQGDTAYYAPGTRPALFDLRGIRIGLQICYDVRFPEGYRQLLAEGAQVIVQGFYGAGGPTWKVPVLAAHLRSRAAESGCFVVAANVAGPLQIVVSQIVDPLGLVLAKANQDAEETIRAELDMGRVGESEIRRDLLERFGGP